jgi:hypothetical protein
MLAAILAVAPIAVAGAALAADLAPPGTFDGAVADGRLRLLVDEANSPAAANGEVADASLIAAVTDERASVVRSTPKFEKARLTGILVLETSPRAGFEATTIAGPAGISTTITTNGDQDRSVIEAVGDILNARAKTYLAKLLRGCTI